MIGNRIPALALSTALAIICLAPPANAAPFDGTWNILGKADQAAAARRVRALFREDAAELQAAL